MNKLWLLMLLGMLSFGTLGCEVDGEADIDDDDAGFEVQVDEE